MPPPMPDWLGRHLVDGEGRDVGALIWQSERLHGDPSHERAAAELKGLASAAMLSSKLLREVGAAAGVDVSWFVAPRRSPLDGESRTTAALYRVGGFPMIHPSMKSLPNKDRDSAPDGVCRPQPRWPRVSPDGSRGLGRLPGLSCTMAPPSAMPKYLGLRSQYSGETAGRRSSARQFYNQVGCSVVVFPVRRLPVGSAVPAGLHVDHDGAGDDPHHVTLAVAEPEGLPLAYPGELDSCSAVSVQAVEDLPWEIIDHVILNATPEWPDRIRLDGRFAPIRAAVTQALNHCEADLFFAIQEWLARLRNGVAHVRDIQALLQLYWEFDSGYADEHDRAVLSAAMRWPNA